MKNKIIGSLLLGAALGLGGAIVSPVPGVAFAAEGADGFSDVPKDHWAYEALDYLAKDGIIEGYGDGTFRGNRTMTRYEMASIVAKATQNGGGSLGGNAVLEKLQREFKQEIDDDFASTNEVPYSGGEFRSKEFFGYGRYECSLKAIRNDVVSSFFTYTGPSDKNPWDEIDVEVLGKDTTKVQFNYFRDGKGEHEYMYDLGFDASEDFHTYAFEWHKDHIIWFVDGKEAYRADKSIPVTKGKIMMNAWAGKNVDEWLKPFDDSDLPIVAEYQWVKFTPFDE